MPEAENKNMFPEGLPQYLTQELSKAYSGEDCRRIAQGYASSRMSSMRTNRLKDEPEKTATELDVMGIRHSSPTWYRDAFVFSTEDEEKVRGSSMFEEGRIYLQNLSSMIPPLMTDFPEGCDVLDMCAAPGGKTTQIVSLTGGKVNVTACENDRVRAERLRFNLIRQGCRSVNVLVTDARKLDSFLKFDRIILDAPCSGTGTFLTEDPSSYRAFSEKLAVNSSKLQKQLLKKGLSMLKKGGVLVYSTCSVLPMENEDVIRAVLPGSGAELVPFPEKLSVIPRLCCGVPEGLVVCPGKEHEGFFAAVIRKK
jgi:ribosomal RNA methyltransferase Nop2